VTGSSTGYPVRKRLRCSAIEKAFDMDTRNTMDALIARLFYSCGLSFNIARNPYYREAFKFAANHNLSAYVPPSYNKLRTTLLKQGLMLRHCWIGQRVYGRKRELAYALMDGLMHKEDH
jgi:hypothetical protein